MGPLDPVSSVVFEEGILLTRRCLKPVQPSFAVWAGLGQSCLPRGGHSPASSGLTGCWCRMPAAFLGLCRPAGGGLEAAVGDGSACRRLSLLWEGPVGIQLEARRGQVGRRSDGAAQALLWPQSFPKRQSPEAGGVRVHQGSAGLAQGQLEPWADGAAAVGTVWSPCQRKRNLGPCPGNEMLGSAGSWVALVHNSQSRRSPMTPPPPQT